MTVTLFKALADATRIRLLRLLIKHELSVNELVKVLKMGQSRISRHLRVLSDAGLLTNRRDGLWVFYHANADGEQKDFLRAVAPYLEDIPQGPEDTVHCNRLLEEKNVAMLTRHGVYSESELRSRYDIQLENYIRTVRIEALTMLDMAKREILPAVAAFSAAVADGIAKKKAALPGLSCSSEAKLVERLTALIDSEEAAHEVLAAAVEELDAMEDDTAAAFQVRDAVIPAMARLRAVCDEAETLTAADFWPFPTYGELLFGV